MGTVLVIDALPASASHRTYRISREVSLNIRGLRGMSESVGRKLEEAGGVRLL